MSTPTPSTPSEPESYRKLREAAAWWREPEQRLIQVSGKDAASYLQTQLTQDLVGLEPGQSLPAALVERKGRLRALMTAARTESGFWLLPECGAETLYAHLESFHFVEDVALELDAGWLRLRLEGPASFEILHELSGQSLAAMPRGGLRSLAIPGGSVWVLNESYSGESGIRLFCRQASAAALLQALSDFGVSELEPAALELMRIEAGQPRWGVDMDETTLLPETGLEKQTVSYDKGCYLGQEVIARIRSYGVVPRALIGLVLDAEPLAGGELELGGKKVGRISSWAWSPRQQAWLALAYLHKAERENGKALALRLGSQTLQATVRRLPFYTPASAGELARGLYEQALTIFADADETQAIPLLEAAIAKDPHLADAYEVLGVILSRQGRQEEAITIMKQLAEVAPEEPMAHTNLSRFYMLLGDKATAETHMAEATRLNMLRSQQAVQAQRLAEQERARKEEMMGMFREVLESEDSEDLVANFGLGKALYDLERAAEALPYLEKATRVEPLYSVAWLHLGKAREALADFAGARHAYLRGREAAAEKGDLMPLKEMEQRLAALPARPEEASA